jgi:hypothetical protein
VCHRIKDKDESRLDQRPDGVLLSSWEESTGFNVHLQWYDCKERVNNGVRVAGNTGELSKVVNAEDCTAEDLSLKTQRPTHWQIESFTM